MKKHVIVFLSVMFVSGCTPAEQVNTSQQGDQVQVQSLQQQLNQKQLEVDALQRQLAEIQSKPGVFIISQAQSFDVNGDSNNVLLFTYVLQQHLSLPWKLVGTSDGKDLPNTLEKRQEKDKYGHVLYYKPYNTLKWSPEINGQRKVSEASELILMLPPKAQYPQLYVRSSNNQEYSHYQLNTENFAHPYDAERWFIQILDYEKNRGQVFSIH